MKEGVNFYTLTTRRQKVQRHTVALAQRVTALGIEIAGTERGEDPRGAGR